MFRFVLSLIIFSTILTAPFCVVVAHQDPSFEGGTVNARTGGFVVRSGQMVPVPDNYAGSDLKKVREVVSINSCNSEHAEITVNGVQAVQCGTEVWVPLGFLN